MLADYKSALLQTKEHLGIYLECQFGLIHEIISFSILDEEQVEIVKECVRNRFKQNDKLLEMLLLQKEFDQFANFLVALKKTNQLHLVRFIIHRGGMDINSIFELTKHFL